ncbi:MAG: glycosyltransferase family 25 protein [Pseudomonadota bacterium]
MRALVINTAAATDRMALMARQLGAIGLDWDRLDAVTPDTLSPGPDDPFWQRWQRPMRVTEMALTASHMAAWRRVIEARAPILILEDDALLSPSVPQFLAGVTGRGGMDHLSLETRGRKKLLARAAGPVWRMWQDRTGSAAYVAWPEGAQDMLARAEIAAAPSDALISETRAQRSFQAVPALSVQFDMCEAYGIAPPIRTPSLIDVVEKPPVPRGAGFRRRRILGQVEMGLRALSHPMAQHVHVQPAKDLVEAALALTSKTD